MSDYPTTLTMHQELTAFVTACADEDELIALATQTCGCGRCNPSPEWTIDGDVITGIWIGLQHTTAPGYINPEQGAHIVRQCPAQTLREVEARRRRIDLAMSMLDDPPTEDDGPHAAIAYGMFSLYALNILSIEAKVYAGQPGYRAEWGIR